MTRVQKKGVGTHSAAAIRQAGPAGSSAVTHILAFLQIADRYTETRLAKISRRASASQSRTLTFSRIARRI